MLCVRHSTGCWIVCMLLHYMCYLCSYIVKLSHVCSQGEAYQYSMHILVLVFGMVHTGCLVYCSTLVWLL